MPLQSIMAAIEAQVKADAARLWDMGMIATAVFRRRLDATQVSLLPLIQIEFTGDTKVSDYSDSPRIENRQLSFRMEYRIEAAQGDLGADIEDNLLNAAETMRLIIMADETLGNLTSDPAATDNWAVDAIHYVSTPEPVVDASGKIPVGGIAVEFEVFYQLETFSALIVTDNLDTITGGIDSDQDDVSEADITINFTP
jgi:hypothetical protein